MPELHWVTFIRPCECFCSLSKKLHRFVHGEDYPAFKAYFTHETGQCWEVTNSFGETEIFMEHELLNFFTRPQKTS
jgi:hypothetical protein